MATALERLKRAMDTAGTTTVSTNRPITGNNETSAYERLRRAMGENYGSSIYGTAARRQASQEAAEHSLAKSQAGQKNQSTSSTTPTQEKFQRSTEQWTADGGGRRSTATYASQVDRVKKLRRQAAADNDTQALDAYTRQLKAMRADAEEPTLLDRAVNTLTGAAKGSGASYVNLGGTGLETLGRMGSFLQDQQETRQAAQDREYLARYEQELADAVAAGDEDAAKWAQIKINQAKYRLKTNGEQGNYYDDVNRDAAQKVYQTADQLQDASAADIEQAKEGLGGFGSMVVDAGTSFTQSLMDNAMGAATGTGMLPFVARAFGGSVQEARRGGADLEEQLVYGGAEAAKEYITEKLFGLALPQKISGAGGSFDDAVEKGIRNVTERLAKTAGGQKVLGGVMTWLAGGVTEGLEEGIGSLIENTLINPYLRDWDPDTRTTQEKFEDGLYDMLVGGISGLMGVPNLLSYTTGETGRNDAKMGADAQTAEQAGNFTATAQNAARGITEQLISAGATEAEAEALAPVLEAVLNGEEISGNQAGTIAKNEAAVSVLETATGEVINTDAPLGEVKSTIRSLARGQSVQTEQTAAVDTAAQTQATEARETASTAPATMEAVTQSNVQAYDMGRVRKAADSLGENGAKALTASYDGSVQVDDYYAGFANYYEAGISGLDMGKVQSQYAAQLTEAQKFAAYSAGQNDAAASLKRERQAAKYAKVAGSDSGLVFDDFVANTLDTATGDRINSVAKALGVRVRFAPEDSITDEVGNAANAQIQGSEILIEQNNPNPVTFLVGHEITHRMQELAPREYRELRNFVAQLGEVQEDAQRKRGLYQGTYEEALDEATADYVGSLMDENGEVLDNFIERHRENRTLLERLRDAFLAVAAKLTGAEKKAAQTAEGKLTAAMEAASKQATTLQGKADGATMGETRNSLKGKYQEISRQAWRQIQRERMSRYGNNFDVLPHMDAFHAHDMLFVIENFDESNFKVVEAIDPAKNQEKANIVWEVMKYDDIEYASEYRRRFENLRRWQRRNASDSLSAENTRTGNSNAGASSEYGNTRDGNTASGKSSGTDQIKKKFSLKTPVEETRDLLALHNKDEASILAALKLGGLPMPSIAVVKATEGHSKYGPISLVFNKATIDPQADSRNKVYGGDAWTPTSPRVDYPVNSKKAAQIERELHTLAGNTAVAGGIFGNSAALRSMGIDETTSMTTEELARRLAQTDTVRAAYLADQGETLEPAKREKVWDKFGNDTLNKAIDRLGVQELAGIVARLETGESVESALGESAETIRDILREHYREAGEPMLRHMAVKRKWSAEEINANREARIARSMESVTPFTLEDIVFHAWDMYEDSGATKGEIDRSATSDALRKAVNDSDVEAWMTEKLDGLLGEGGIYNGKDPYTPSGNSRSFSQLHYAYTLENIVKAMKEGQKERGEAAWGATAKTLQSVATPEYRSIQDIKADSGRLGLAEGAEYNAKVQAIDEQIESIIARVKKGNEAHSSNPFIESDIISEVLLDAAKGKKTADAIMRAFSKEGYKISSKTAQDIQAAFKAAAEMPTGYFEAKPQRAVGFDEVLVAVIPSDSSEKLRSALAGKGVNVLTYESGNEADRLAKVNSVEGARFSRKEGTYGPAERALRKENDLLRERVDYWKGQTKRTARVTTDKKAVAKAAKQLIESYGADIAAEDIQGDLQSLFDYLASGYDGKDELTWEESYRRARNIARTLIENAVAVDDTMYEQYSDLRDYLRTTKIVYGKEYQGDISDYNDFRKRNFGRMNLGSQGATNIDQVYQEMSSLWPEFFNEREQMHPTDQLLRIAEVLDDLYDITEYNPFSREMDQAVTGAANEIMEMFFDLPQTRKTFADRQAAKLDAAKAKGRQQVQQVREERDAKLAALREENRERVKNAINRERQTRARQINALKDRYAAKDAKGRQQRAARELRGKIVRHAKALSQKLLHPSDKQHIPESLRGAVAAMLESINLESQYSIGKDGKRAKRDDGAPTRRTEAFRALKEQYAKIALEGGSDMVIDPSLLGSDAEGIRGSFDAVIAMKDTKLADMSAEQLATVWQVVKTVEHSVNTAGKVLSKAKYAKTADWAQAISTDSGSRRAKTSLTKNHALIDLETPYTFFSHYGEAGKAVYRMLRDAQDQQQLMVDRVAEEVRKIVDPKTVKELEETTRTFTTERGEELTLSTAQVMELYELTKRKQAHDHLLKGGIVQPEVKSAKIRRGTDSILLTADDLANITGTLTAEQVKIADGLQGLTTGLLADYGNRASMDAYGYKKFTEKDYWPIKSAEEGLHANIEKGGSNTRSIKNIGMAKTTMPHASNALDLPGIFTTFANHAADMTDYASWLCTMEDANRLFNFQFRDEEGNLTGKTIKGLLDRVGGPGSQEYWYNLMEDIQNGITAPGDSPMWDIFGRTIGSFKGAAVGANARVVIQQPTAFFRAAAVLDPADMTRGLARGATKGNGWKKALQYSPIAMRKDAGGFDISSPRQMNETLFDSRTRVRKLNDALSAPAGTADAVTWGKLWNACEWATVRDHQGLAKGSEAFYRQTAKLFAEVIDQTQVVDGVLQRSNIMRSSNAVVKQATSFMGEPIMSLNLLMRSYDQMRYEQDSRKRGKAIKTLGRAATALVVTNVVNALAQSVIDAMRDDDEDKKYWERFWSAFTGLSGDEESAWDKAWNAVMEGNVGSNMNPLGQIPFVKDALSIIQGYDVSRTEMEIATDLIQAGQTAIQSADGNGKKTRAYAVKGLLAAGAKMFGIPASNLARDMWGLVRSVAVETDNIPLQYEMEKAIYNITNSGNYTRYYDILYRALEQGDTEVYEHIYADMAANGIPEDKIRSGMESRMKKAQGVDSVTDLENRFLSPQQTESYERVYNRVTGSAARSAASEEQWEALEDDLYDLTVGNTDGLKLQEKIDGGAAYGIDETDYLLYRLALRIVDQPSESGKLGSYTGEEVEAAIDMLTGLDDEARGYLWAAAGKSEKSNPYK